MMVQQPTSGRSALGNALESVLHDFMDIEMSCCAEYGRPEQSDSDLRQPEKDRSLLWELGYEVALLESIGEER